MSMLRTTLLRTAQCASRSAFRAATPISRSVAPASYAVTTRSGSASSLRFSGARFYSAPAGLGKDEVQGRIMDLLKGFDKITDASKINGTSHFTNDLGLDSLDTVEVVMAIEEEFSIEIPDKEADAIHSISQAVEYILAQPDGKKHPTNDYEQNEF